MVQETNTTIPSYTATTASSCPNMLPCGVCRLLMMNCPRQTTWVTPTWQAPTTNAARIRSMTDEELDRWLTAFVCSNVAPHATARGAAKKGRLLEWLKKEGE